MLYFIPDDEALDETNIDLDDRASLLKGEGDASSITSSQSMSESQGGGGYFDRKARMRNVPSQPLMHDSPARRTTMPTFNSYTTMTQNEASTMPNLAAPRFQRQDSHGSFRSQSRSYSDIDGPAAPDTPMRPSLKRHLSELDRERQRRANDDLQSWMQRQQVRNLATFSCWLEESATI